MSTSVEKEMTINTSTSFVEWKLTSPWSSVSNFDEPLFNRLCQFRYDTNTLSTTWTSSTVQHVMSTCVQQGNDHLPLHLSSRNQDRHGDTSPISTPTAQPMIGTERLHMGINDAQARLCVTFGGAVDWKSRQLELTAQSTTELRNRHMIDASNGMSGRMVAWEELRAWHCLASVFCLLFVFRQFFNDLVFDGRDNSLEQC